MIRELRSGTCSEAGLPVCRVNKLQMLILGLLSYLGCRQELESHQFAIFKCDNALGRPYQLEFRP
jgi:hypothetical protein